MVRGEENAGGAVPKTVRIQKRLPDVDTPNSGFQSQPSFFLGLEGTSLKTRSKACCSEKWYACRFVYLSAAASRRWTVA